ncbi:MAG: hypothetical protein IPM82_24495 [Saprospiraceae bacterium]|nr:hypothetical protein [Saprospiraceae bacterium]
MKKITTLNIIFILNIFIFSPIAKAQWTELPSPYGDIIYDFCIKGESVFYSNYTDFLVKVYRSNDLINWEELADIPTNSSGGFAKTFAVGDKLYVFAKNENWNTSDAFYSSDDGQTWTVINLPTPYPNVLLPTETSIYCANQLGIYKSVNFGSSWQLIESTSSKPLSLESIGGQKMLLATVNKLYRSINDGVSWQILSTPYTANVNNYPEVSIFNTNSGQFLKWKEFNNCNLYRSDNNGNSWTQLDFPLNSGSPINVWSMTSIGGKLWGIFPTGILSSEDNGENWQEEKTPIIGFDIISKGDSLLLGGIGGFLNLMIKHLHG